MKPNDSTTTLSELKGEVIRFIRERDWEQFHTGKNLSMSIAIEAAELMEHFQWAEGREPVSKELAEKIRHEIADVVIYALDFCNLLGIDLSQAIRDKIRHNEEKYPAEVVRGKAHKYTFYASKGTKAGPRAKKRR